jgi:hypothetical protein
VFLAFREGKRKGKLSAVSRYSIPVFLFHPACVSFSRQSEVTINQSHGSCSVVDQWPSHGVVYGYKACSLVWKLLDVQDNAFGVLAHMAHSRRVIHNAHIESNTVQPLLGSRFGLRCNSRPLIPSSWYPSAVTQCVSETPKSCRNWSLGRWGLISIFAEALDAAVDSHAFCARLHAGQQLGRGNCGKNM